MAGDAREELAQVLANTYRIDPTKNARVCKADRDGADALLANPDVVLRALGYVTDIAKLIEAIEHLRRDGNDGFADKHADLLVARVREDWGV